MMKWRLAGLSMCAGALGLCCTAGEAPAEKAVTLDAWTEQYLTAAGSGVWITGLEFKGAAGTSLGILNTMSEHVQVGGRPLALRMPPYDVIVTDRQMRLRVQYIDSVGALQSYDVLIGPYESLTPKVIGHFRPPKSAIPIYVMEGWAYLSGTSPKGETTRASASGKGTHIIVQVVKTPTVDVQRVFLVGNATDEVEVVSKVVQPDGSVDKATLTALDTYVEIGADGKVGSPQAINAAPPDVQQFVTYVKNQAAAAGL